MRDPTFLCARPIAHRGLHGPLTGLTENTPAAVRAAFAAGYGVEVDLQASRDGAAFVFHDDELLRLTGQPGRLVDHTRSALSRLCLHDGTPLWTLDALLAQAHARLPLVIEVKAPSAAVPGFVKGIVASLRRHRRKPLALKSFSPRLVMALRQAGAPVPVGLVGDACTPFSHLLASQPDFLSWDWRALPPRGWMKRHYFHTRPVLAWTVRDARAAAKAREAGAQIIFEGDPAHWIS